MAKRSDFAQKLLDDLRVRKERMAAAHSSGRSSTMAGDTYSYFRQTQKGFTEIKKLDVLGSKAGYTHKRSKGDNRSLTIGDSSKQIVSHGRSRRSEQMGDLSLAFAFALENGGKLQKIDSSGSNSMLGFLQQIGRRSVNFGKMEKGRSIDIYQSSTSQFPTLSPLHVKEISKGAQKLNQILRACSNGINFDSYSIEIGKELLKGAMDLEESLRMLVNLQDASEHMVTPQRKNRIKLLEGDEDEKDDIVRIDEQKQLKGPRFSFDKPSRDSNGLRQVSRTGLKQRLSLTYSSEASNLNHESQDLISSNSQTGSARYINDFRALGVLSERERTSSSSRSKCQMGIPNIIAKLMGLEEIPGAMDSKYGTQTDSSSKRNINGREKKTAVESTKNDEPKSKHAENMALQNARQKVKQSTKTLVTQNTAFGLQVEKNPGTRYASHEMMVNDEKPPWKDSANVEGKNARSGSRKATAKMRKQQQISIQLNEITGSQNSILENASRRDDTILRERRETKELILKHGQFQGAPNTQVIQETTKGLQHKTGQNGSTSQAEQRYANRLFPGNQQNMVDNSLTFQQLNFIQKSEHQQEKHQAAEKQNVRQKLQGRVHKGIDVVLKSPSRSTHEMVNLPKKHQHLNQSIHGTRSSTDATDVMPHKGFPYTKNHENMVRNGSSTNLMVNIKDSMLNNLDQSVSSTDVEPQSEKAKANIMPIMKEKAVHITPAQKKGDNTKVHKRETPRRIDEVMTRRNGTNLVRPLKHPISILHEMKQRRQDKIGGSKRAEQGSAVKHNEAEVPVIMSKKSEANTKLFIVAEHVHKDDKRASSVYNSARDECHNQKEPHTQASNDTCLDIIAKVSNDQQDQEAPLSNKDQELECLKIESGPLTVSGNHAKYVELSLTTQPEPQKVSKLSTQQQPLTENENHLKQILIKSQLFLNTAEALFKLNVPISVLDSTGHNYQDEDSRLILDCGYELMRRKGKRQELSVHPFVKVSISSMKITSLDDLVKQLYIDFEKLKSYGSDECDAADYLLRMLELDVLTMDPDVNCLWDIGWNDKMFAFIEKDDVIRDVERHIFNILIGEITRDFLHVSKPN